MQIKGTGTCTGKIRNGRSRNRQGAQSRKQSSRQKESDCVQISTNKIFYRKELMHFQKPPSIGVFRERCSENNSKFTREHPCQSLISIKLLCNFFEITLRYGCSDVNLLYIFKTAFPANTSGGLLLHYFTQGASTDQVKLEVTFTVNIVSISNHYK